MSNDRSAFEDCQEELSRELVACADQKFAAPERLAAAQERLAAAQEFEQEQRIMSKDIDKVVSWQRDYYLKLQQKIMQKHVGGSGPSNMLMPYVCVIK
jgi:ATP-dependent Lon protease